MVKTVSDTVGKVGIRRVIVTETKTVGDLLVELKLTTNHVVLVDGKKVSLDTIINENDTVVILPLIEGG